MIRFYVPGTIESHVFLEGEPAHHALRVQRVRIGDPVIVFNGEGGEFEGVIERCAKTSVAIAIGKFRAIERESRLHVMLAQGISAGDNMDFTIQKAVELGVTRIQPLATARSVVRLSDERAKKRLAHWQRVVISACEQCGRNRLPPVEEVVTLHEWLQQPSAEVGLLLSPSARQALGSLPHPQTSLRLLVGPEGGLGDDEARAAVDAGFSPIALGPRTLRTETAALAALSAMQTLWGDYRALSQSVADAVFDSAR